MFKIKATTSIFILFLCISGAWAQAEKTPLTLDDCIVKAVDNNLGVAVEVLNPELAGFSVLRAKEIFIPSLSFGYSTQNTNTPSFSWIEAADNVATDYIDYSARLTQLIPTGGQVTASFYTYKNDTNLKFQTINPRYGSTLTLNFTQPLLKDFGLKMTRKEIIIAQNNRDISENQFKSTLLETVFNAEEAYWNLVYSIENLKVMQRSLDLAEKLLAKNQKEVEVGTLAEIEIVSAQAEVATRKADILQAEAMVKNYEALLKTIINLTAEELPPGSEVIPTDKPFFQRREISLEEALKKAMDNRPDLQSYRIDLDSKNLEVSYAKNQLLPDLSFQAAYWSPGISGTQILYLDDNPLSEVVIGEIEGKAGDAISDAMNFKHKNWAVGLTLSIPMNTLLSRAQYAQARVSLDQTSLKIKNQEQQIYLEVQNAVRAVETDYLRVQAYEAARALAEKKLEAEEKKLLVGLTTNYLVLQYQRDLANAQGAELRAVIDYNLSLARLEKAMGTTLTTRNIKLTD